MRHCLSLLIHANLEMENMPVRLFRNSLQISFFLAVLGVSGFAHAQALPQFPNSKLTIEVLGGANTTLAQRGERILIFGTVRIKGEPDQKDTSIFIPNVNLPKRCWSKQPFWVVGQGQIHRRTKTVSMVKGTCVPIRRQTLPRVKVSLEATFESLTQRKEIFVVSMANWIHRSGDRLFLSHEVVAKPAAASMRRANTVSFALPKRFADNVVSVRLVDAEGKALAERYCKTITPFIGDPFVPNTDCTMIDHTIPQKGGVSTLKAAKLIVRYRKGKEFVIRLTDEGL